jgi:hypothetical protein
MTGKMQYIWVPLKWWLWKNARNLSEQLINWRKDVFHCWGCCAVSPINSVCYLKRILHRYSEYFFRIYNDRGIRQTHCENNRRQ